MPRQERLHSATGIYHVMLRGINKQDIFEDDEDYIQFLKILNGLVVRHDDDGHVLPAHCTFYAYCLMTNHIHLLMREQDEQIGESVKRIGVAYARYYNRKYERNGHLFQDHFLSEPVNNIEYFMTLMRYVHQNPVHAGLTAEGLTRGQTPCEHYVRAYADKYDFDMKSWANPFNWIRNAETIIGSYHAGKGTAYEINIYGSKQLEPLYPWIK